MERGGLVFDLKAAASQLGRLTDNRLPRDLAEIAVGYVLPASTVRGLKRAHWEARETGDHSVLKLFQFLFAPLRGAAEPQGPDRKLSQMETYLVNVRYWGFLQSFLVLAAWKGSPADIIWTLIKIGAHPRAGRVTEFGQVLVGAEPTLMAAARGDRVVYDLISFYFRIREERLLDVCQRARNMSSREVAKIGGRTLARHADNLALFGERLPPAPQVFAKNEFNRMFMQVENFLTEMLERREFGL